MGCHSFRYGGRGIDCAGRRSRSRPVKPAGMRGRVIVFQPSQDASRLQWRQSLIRRGRVGRQVRVGRDRRDRVHSSEWPPSQLRRFWKNQKMNQFLGRQPLPCLTESKASISRSSGPTALNGRSPAERDTQLFCRVTAPSVHQMVAHPRARSIDPPWPRAVLNWQQVKPLVEPDSLPRLQPAETVKSSVQRYWLRDWRALALWKASS